MLVCSLLDKSFLTLIYSRLLHLNLETTKRKQLVEPSRNDVTEKLTVDNNHSTTSKHVKSSITGHIVYHKTTTTSSKHYITSSNIKSTKTINTHQSAAPKTKNIYNTTSTGVRDSKKTDTHQPVTSKTKDITNTTSTGVRSTVITTKKMKTTSGKLVMHITCDDLLILLFLV